MTEPIETYYTLVLGNRIEDSRLEYNGQPLPGVMGVWAGVGRTLGGDADFELGTVLVIIPALRVKVVHPDELRVKGVVKLGLEESDVTGDRG